MKNKIRFKVVFMTIIGGLIIFQFFRFVPVSYANDILVIGNKDINETSITQQTLKNIFLGKIIEWNDNTKIVVATLDKGNTHKLFLERYLDKTESQYKIYFKKLLYSGKGNMPKTFKNEKSLIHYVANTNGAIGYISSDVDAENVKIIKIK